MNRFLIHVISMVFAVASIPHVAAIEPTVPNNLPKEAWANALLDQILSPEKSPFYAEGPPSREWETKQLIALGDAGWEQTYRRLENGHFHTAIADVLGSRRLAFRETEQAKTERILNLLKAKDFKVRQWIPQIIKRREPTNGNRLLREFLSDADTELREALLIAFNPKNATAEDVEKVIGFLDDPSPNVRFRANDFLERATGHLFVREGKSENTKAEWTEWWVQQKPADIDTILKRELTRDANLLVNSDEKIRETAGIVLIAHSCQIYFGFHQKNMWWGVHDRESSRDRWLEWLDLRYDEKKPRAITTWEYSFQMHYPDLSLDALRATISMNVKDLDSVESSVRAMARETITMLLEDACPFQTGSSNPEDDWLNDGIKSWWKQRMSEVEN